MVTRRRLLTTLSAGSAAALAQTNQRRFDLLIRNGTLLDPSRSINKRQDLAILDGVIAAIEDSIPPERALEVVDAAGLYVTPGLVDLHTHCYHSATGLGIEADPVAARSGVTTWVDAGSFGYDQATGFRRFIVQPPNLQGNPESEFDVVVLPDGNVLGVKLKKPSGNAAYDNAVERAISRAQPLHSAVPAWWTLGLNLTFGH